MPLVITKFPIQFEWRIEEKREEKNLSICDSVNFESLTVAQVAI